VKIKDYFNSIPFLSPAPEVVPDNPADEGDPESEPEATAVA